MPDNREQNVFTKSNNKPPVHDTDSVDPKAPVANPGNIDLSQLSPQELKIYKMYGKLPSKKDLFQHKLQERKYFDSGDYALRRAGVNSDDLQSSPIANNNLPLTNPSGLRESIIKRRMSSSANGPSNVGAQRLERQGSISSGPPPRSPNK
ncbi:unnamed protein product [Kluyveromyces dobzhanskii CBS 2104]|uniref:mRNA stability protein n=1 Tax=Kluyveromyces dobzhanskii CBS 2104 TaxID=1427455 RepID=A0A0A8LE00_9SACH|nr:unnamed protein product [Kluyveromyces dobzhanskii CBS 2104]